MADLARNVRMWTDRKSFPQIKMQEMYQSMTLAVEEEKYSAQYRGFFRIFIVKVVIFAN
jgi:hypothetical protein